MQLLSTVLMRLFTPTPRPMLGAGAVAALLLGVPVLTGAGGPEQQPAAIYARACASCHGDDGTGQPRHVRGFATPPPDFTDCGFATREPDGDWAAVVRHGGPVRAFDRMMPAFDDALTDAEIARALEHVRARCRGRRQWPRGELNLPRALVTTKAFPEDEVVLSTAVDARAGSAVMSELIVEKRIGSRGQIELVVPFGALESEEHGWSGGLGDVGLATKWAVLHSHRSGSILSLALELLLPTGREERGLGSGATVLEPFVAYGQLLPANGFVQLQGGAGISTEPDTAPHELFWRGVAGVSLAAAGDGRVWSPMIGVLGARELEQGARVHWDLVPQLQVTLSTRQHVRLAAGARIPVDGLDGRSTRVVAYLLWDWFDGGLLEGW